MGSAAVVNAEIEKNRIPKESPTRPPYHISKHFQYKFQISLKN
jgi:hypothetical protein